jgi:hypothetical protein
MQRKHIMVIDDVPVQLQWMHQAWWLSWILCIWEVQRCRSRIHWRKVTVHGAWWSYYSFWVKMATRNSFKFSPRSWTKNFFIARSQLEHHEQSTSSNVQYPQSMLQHSLYAQCLEPPSPMHSLQPCQNIISHHNMFSLHSKPSSIEQLLQFSCLQGYSPFVFCAHLSSMETRIFQNFREDCHACVC